MKICHAVDITKFLQNVEYKNNDRVFKRNTKIYSKEK